MFTALTTDDFHHPNSTDPLPEGDNEEMTVENGGTGTVTATTRTKMDPRPMVYRTTEPGYWTLCLLPFAIYFADQKFLEQSFPAVTIIGYNSLLLFSFHSMGSNLGVQGMAEIMEYLKGFNLVMALLTIGYAFCVHGKEENFSKCL